TTHSGTRPFPVRRLIADTTPGWWRPPPRSRRNLRWPASLGAILLIVATVSLGRSDGWIPVVAAIATVAGAVVAFVWFVEPRRQHHEHWVKAMQVVFVGAATLVVAVALRDTPPANGTLGHWSWGVLALSIGLFALVVLLCQWRASWPYFLWA